MGFGFRVLSLGLRIQGSGFRIQDSGFGNKDFGFRVQGLGLGSRFQGLWVEESSRGLSLRFGGWDCHFAEARACFDSEGFSSTNALSRSLSLSLFLPLFLSLSPLSSLLSPLSSLLSPLSPLSLPPSLSPSLGLRVEVTVSRRRMTASTRRGTERSRDVQKHPGYSRKVEHVRERSRGVGFGLPFRGGS